MTPQISPHVDPINSGTDTPSRPRRTHDYVTDGAEIYRRSFATIRAEADLTRIPASAEKLAVLRKHCADAGRDYASIRKTAMTLCIIGETDAEAAALVPPWAPQVFTGDIARHGLVGTIDTIRRRLADYEAAGVNELARTSAKSNSTSGGPEGVPL